MVRKFGSELREFLMRGNVIDLAVGVVIGGAFGTIVKSLVDDVIMPPIGLLLNGVDFSNLVIVLKDGAKGAGDYSTIAAAKAAGAVTLNYGLFINAIIQFLIVGTAIFMLVRAVNKMHKPPVPEAAPETKDCPMCFTAIPVQAHRCPHCTSQLDATTLDSAH